MKNLVLVAAVISLTGCVVAPYNSDRDVVVYPAVRIEPSVEVVYMWDPIQYLFYYVDGRNSRHYMPYGWRHPHGHRPRGYDHWDRR